MITSEPEVAEPRTITRAQACEGRFGIQPNFISQRTGQPIDCGPAPQVTAAADVTPQPDAAQQQQRLTRTQACARAAQTGEQFRSAITGLPLECGTPPTAPAAMPTTTAAATPTVNDPFARLRRDLAAPQRHYSNPLDWAPGSTTVRPGPNPGTNPSPGRTTLAYSNPLDAAPGSIRPGPNPGTAAAAGSDCIYANTLVGMEGLPNLCGPQPRPAAPDTVTRARAQTTSVWGMTPTFIQTHPWQAPYRPHWCPTITSASGVMAA